MSLAPQPPLPAPPILTPPFGLLGFLGLKSGGAQPGPLAGFLQPAIDMTRFYVTGNRTTLGSLLVVAMTWPGPATIITVPNGVAWLVEHCSGNATLGVAANCYAHIVATDAQNFPFYRSRPDPLRGLTGEDFTVSMSDIILIPPGGKLQVKTIAAAAPTAFNYTFNVIGQQFPV
jgi:hypothetical protein